MLLAPVSSMETIIHNVLDPLHVFICRITIIAFVSSNATEDLGLFPVKPMLWDVASLVHDHTYRAAGGLGRRRGALVLRDRYVACARALSSITYSVTHYPRTEESWDADKGSS